MSPYQQYFARNAHILQKSNLGPRVACPRYTILMKELEPLFSKLVCLCSVTGQDHGDLASRLPPQQVLMFATNAGANSEKSKARWGAAAGMNTCCHGSLEQIQWVIDSSYVLNFWRFTSYRTWGRQPSAVGKSELKSQEAAPSPRLMLAIPPMQ